MAQTMVHPHMQQVKVASGLDIVAAIWLIVSAFVVPMTRGLAWSNVIVGVIVGIFAISRNSRGPVALSWLNALLGAWTFFSPWIIPGATERGPIVNNVITGAVIFILAVWSAVASHSETPSMQAR